MSQNDKPQAPRNSKLPRREFLANLLFAGTMLSVTALQSQYDLLARKDPKDEGWDIPKDKDSSSPQDGWELPEDLMKSEQRPQQPRPKPPQPQPNGGVRPPIIRGRVMPTPGSVSPPRPPKP